MNFSCTETLPTETLQSDKYHTISNFKNRTLLNNKGTIHNQNNEPPAHGTEQQNAILATSDDNKKPYPNHMSNDAFSSKNTPIITTFDDKDHKEDEEISIEQQAKTLLSADGIKLHKEDITKSELFCLAVSEGGLKTVKLLLQDPEVKAEINQKDENGYSLLHKAVDKNYIEIAKELIDAGVEIDAITDQKSGCRTALHIAAQSGNIEILEKLIEKGADVNKTTGSMYGQRTALHIAVDGNHEQIVAKLLDKKGKEEQEVNVTDCFGSTPLHIAAQRAATIKASIKKEENLDDHIKAKRSNLEIIKILINKGANLDAKNQDNQTPLDCYILVTQDDNDDCANYLKTGVF